MSYSSVSRTRLTIDIGGSTTQCDLKRHLAPKTVGLILRSLPISANAHKLGTSMVYVKVEIESGMERPRREFNRGDIAFMPSKQAVCFFTKRVEYGDAALTPLGRIKGTVEPFDAIRPGDALVIRKP